MIVRDYSISVSQALTQHTQTQSLECLGLVNLIGREPHKLYDCAKVFFFWVIYDCARLRYSRTELLDFLESFKIKRLADGNI